MTLPGFLNLVAHNRALLLVGIEKDRSPVRFRVRNIIDRREVVLTQADIEETECQQMKYRLMGRWMEEWWNTDF